MVKMPIECRPYHTRRALLLAVAELALSYDFSDTFFRNCTIALCELYQSTTVLDKSHNNTGTLAIRFNKQTFPSDLTSVSK